MNPDTFWLKPRSTGGMRGYLRFLSLHPPLAEPGFRLMPRYAAGLSPASTAPQDPPWITPWGPLLGVAMLSGSPILAILRW